MQSQSLIQDRVMARLDSLSPQLRSAANFVVSHPEEIAMRTLRHIAKTANVKPPTLSRLARALDFKTYEELRETCRSEFKNRNRSFADRAQTLQRRNADRNSAGYSSIAISQANSAITNIQKFVETIDLEGLREATDTIVSARNVVLVGGSSTLTLANYFARMAHMAFDNWTVVGVGGGVWSHKIARLGQDDVVLIVSLHPYSSHCIKAAELSRKAGAAVIAITDGFNSPLADIADHCFMVETDSPQFFPSHVATLVLIEGLMGMIVRRGGEHIAEHIRAAEAVSGELGEYWQN